MTTYCLVAQYRIPCCFLVVLVYCSAVAMSFRPRAYGMDGGSGARVVQGGWWWGQWSGGRTDDEDRRNAGNSRRLFSICSGAPTGCECVFTAYGILVFWMAIVSNQEPRRN